MVTKSTTDTKAKNTKATAAKEKKAAVSKTNADGSVKESVKQNSRATAKKDKISNDVTEVPFGVILHPDDFDEIKKLMGKQWAKLEFPNYLEETAVEFETIAADASMELKPIVLNIDDIKDWAKFNKISLRKTDNFLQRYVEENATDTWFGNFEKWVKIQHNIEYALTIAQEDTSKSLEESVNEFTDFQEKVSTMLLDYAFSKNENVTIGVRCNNFPLADVSASLETSWSSYNAENEALMFDASAFEVVVSLLAAAYFLGGEIIVIAGTTAPKTLYSATIKNGEIVEHTKIPMKILDQIFKNRPKTLYESQEGLLTQNHILTFFPDGTLEPFSTYVAFDEYYELHIELPNVIGDIIARVALGDEVPCLISSLVEDNVKELRFCTLLKNRADFFNVNEVKSVCEEVFFHHHHHHHDEENGEMNESEDENLNDSDFDEDDYDNDEFDENDEFDDDEEEHFCDYHRHLRAEHGHEILDMEPDIDEDEKIFYCDSWSNPRAKRIEANTAGAEE